MAAMLSGVVIVAAFGLVALFFVALTVGLFRIGSRQVGASDRGRAGTEDS
jgi:hypothetical protein